MCSGAIDDTSSPEDQRILAPAFARRASHVASASSSSSLDNTGRPLPGSEDDPIHQALPTHLLLTTFAFLVDREKAGHLVLAKRWTALTPHRRPFIRLF